MHWSLKQQNVDQYVNEALSEQPPPFVYRYDLFRRVQNGRYGRNVSRLGVREIAADCKLSVRTVTEALKGNASKIETLWKLSKYFGVPWLLLFDIDRKLMSDIKDDGTGFIFTFLDPATPGKALGSREVQND